MWPRAALLAEPSTLGTEERDVLVVKREVPMFHVGTSTADVDRIRRQARTSTFTASTATCPQTASS